LIRYSAFVG